MIVIHLCILMELSIGFERGRECEAVGRAEETALRVVVKEVRLRAGGRRSQQAGGYFGEG